IYIRINKINIITRTYVLVFLCIFSCLTFSACNSMYYNALEKVGIEKRDLMMSRIKNAKESQTEAKETFTDALAQFKSIVSLPDSELNKKYDRLSSILKTSENKAKEVTSRINSVENV